MTDFRVENRASGSIGSLIVGGTSGSVLFVDSSGNLGQDNSNFFYDNTNNRFGVQAGTTLGTTIIQAGTGGTQSSSDTSFLNLRSFDNTGTGSGHGFSDCALITRTNGAPFGYASFDARGNTTGSTNYDHYVGYQAYWNYASSGTLGTFSGFASAPTHGGGTCSVLSHFTASDVAGAGVVNTQYGLFVGELTRGASSNWAIYTDGTTPSLFEGTVRFQSDMRLDGTGTFVLDTTAMLGWGSAGSADTEIARVSAGVLAFRDGATPHQIRINSAYTDDSNQEYLQVSASTSGATIQTVAAGSGSARAITIGPAGIAALNFQTNATTRWLINTSANFTPNTNGTLDIGDSTHYVDDIFMDGSLSTTGTRVLKGWFTDIESTNMITIGGTSLSSVTVTLSNKRITRRVVNTTQAATPTINTDNTDCSHITALAQAITSMTTNLSGTPVAGDLLKIDITDDGTARGITWGASFEASGTIALPTTTVISTRLEVGFVWNEVTSKWRCIATA